MKKRILVFTLVFMVLLFTASSILILYYGSETALFYEKYADETLLYDVRNSVGEAVEKAENGEITVQEAFDYITSARSYSECYGLSGDCVAVSIIIFDKNNKELSRYENRNKKNKIPYAKLDEILAELIAEPLASHSSSKGYCIDEFSIDGEKYFCFISDVKNGVILAINNDNFCGEFLGLAVVYIVMGVVLYFKSYSFYKKKEKDRLIKETNGAVL